MSELAFNRVILQKHNRTLGILVIASLAVNALLGVNLLVQANKKPILVSRAEGVLKVLEQEQYKLDEEMLKNFIMMISTQYLNFNSLTLPKQINGIAKYLDVQPVEAIMDSYKKNEGEMVKDQVAHEFTSEEMTITKKNDPFWVELKGVRTIYAKGHKKNIPAVYLFEIKKIQPSESNPYGLIVTKIIEKKVDEKTGKKESAS